MIKRGHAFTEFLIGLAALPPMEYDQKPLGISLQRWVPGRDIECHTFFVISATLTAAATEFS